MPAAIIRLFVRYGLLAAGVVLLNFLIPRLLPGDPLDFGSSEGMEAAVPLSSAAKAQLHTYYHLDEPLHRQLILYLDGLRHGDLGWSIAQPAPVSTLIQTHLPWTLTLLLTSLVCSAIIGTAIGFVAGWIPEIVRSRLLISAAGVLAAIPEFLVAIGVLLVFAVGLGWFPLFGGQTVFAMYGTGLADTTRRFLDISWHLVLPTLTLILIRTASFVLVARDVTAGLRHEPWLTAARGKGLSEAQLARHHVAPNILSPLLTFFGLRLGSVLGGALVVERVFGVPGLGLLGYEAIRARDYPLLQALFLLASLGVLAASLALEVVYLRLTARYGGTHA